MGKPKLFIPGPIQVSDKTFKAFCQPMIGHRSKDFQELYARVQPGLKKLFYTEQPVFVNTGSAWSAMEASLRNLVGKKVLNCMNGAFSDKWYGVANACGKPAEKLQVEWGQPISPELIDAKLKTGEFDAITIIHNETSTGTMSPIEDIAKVLKKYPDVVSIVDVVSSLSVKKIPFDELGLDVMLAGTQKALALPPGASVFAVSEKAFKKAALQKDRGYYLDFVEFRANHDKNMTPTTPSISHFYALESKLEDIFQEGLEARYARHLENAKLARAWAKKHGFELFPKAGFESISLTCIKNHRDVELPANLNKWLKQNKNAVIDGGYGKIKGATFRISHMGDESTANIAELLGWLDEGLKTLGV
ncbi:MAG: alanine--glyoxylate aminotransferase family protein [Methylacidiphilales bacterium]|nr:alanine--glyoxylate aminotransferase family protein [Candidatus Methylacidiphilales bacterium]